MTNEEYKKAVLNQMWHLRDCLPSKYRDVYTKYQFDNIFKPGSKTNKTVESNNLLYRDDQNFRPCRIYLSDLGIDIFEKEHNIKCFYAFDLMNGYEDVVDNAYKFMNPIQRFWHPCFFEDECELTLAGTGISDFTSYGAIPYHIHVLPYIDLACDWDDPLNDIASTGQFNFVLSLDYETDKNEPILKHLYPGRLCKKFSVQLVFFEDKRFIYQDVYNKICDCIESDSESMYFFMEQKFRDNSTSKIYNNIREASKDLGIDMHELFRLAMIDKGIGSIKTTSPFDFVQTYKHKVGDIHLN